MLSCKPSADMLLCEDEIEARLIKKVEKTYIGQQSLWFKTNYQLEKGGVPGKGFLFQLIGLLLDNKFGKEKEQFSVSDKKKMFIKFVECHAF